MSKTLMTIGYLDGGIAIGAGLTRYFPACQGGWNSDNTEANVHITYRQAGTLSNLYIQINANSNTGTTTLRTRVNGGNGAQSVSITSGQTGEFEDSSNTDAIASGDEVNYQFVTGGTGTTITLGVVSSVFDATSDTVQIISAAGSISHNEDSVTRYAGLAGGDTKGSTEANFQMQISHAGTLKNLFVYVTSNSRTTNTVFKTRKNGSTDGNLTVTFGSGVTGILEDTSNTDTVTANDLWNYAIVTGASGGSLVSSNIKVELTTSDGSFTVGFAAGSGLSIGSQTTYLQLGCGPNTFGGTNTELHTRTEANFVFTASKLWCYCSGSGANSATLTLRKNQADTALTISITGTGEFEDTTNSVALVATDEINFKYAATGATWVIRGISMKGGQASAATTPYLSLLGVGA